MSDGINHAQGKRTYGPDGYPINYDPATGHPIASQSALHPPAPIAERLARFEIACEALWPSIRYFGLCGAGADKIALILEIGDLLGKTTASTPIDTAAIVRAAKHEAQQEIAAIIESAPQFREGIGRNLAKDQAEKIRKLQLSSE